MKLKKRWIWLTPLIVVLVALLGFSAWVTLFAGQPQSNALAALNSDREVLVENNSWLIFRPASPEPTTGFIFYPGGFVDPRAYAPLAKNIARQGYFVVVVPMPLKLAVLNPNEANSVINAFPKITRWAIGGHSLGGAMAANFVASHPDAVEGLVFWAAYPADSDNLSNRKIEVVSISASLDGLSTKSKIDASRALLPANTRWVVIEGGNHGQFGDYGAQSGDQPATISPQEQWTQVVSSTVSFLASMN